MLKVSLLCRAIYTEENDFKKEYLEILSLKGNKYTTHDTNYLFDCNQIEPYNDTKFDPCLRTIFNDILIVDMSELLEYDTSNTFVWVNSLFGYHSLEPFNINRYYLQYSMFQNCKSLKYIIKDDVLFIKNNHIHDKKCAFRRFYEDKRKSNNLIYKTRFSNIENYKGICDCNCDCTFDEFIYLYDKLDDPSQHKVYMHFCEVFIIVKLEYYRKFFNMILKIKYTPTQ